MGQYHSSNDITEETFEEDLIRVQSVQQELRSLVAYANTVEDGYIEYTIRTTDRDGNSWETATRYSVVVRVLEELKQKRNIKDLPMMPRKQFFLSSKDEAVIDERRVALNAVLAAVVPRYAGVREVRRFLRLDEGLQIHEARKRREAEEEAKRNDLRRARAVKVEVDVGGVLSEEALREVVRREAMEPIEVKCFIVDTNKTVSITVLGWQLIGESVLSAMPDVQDVHFGGIPVDDEDSFEDLEIESDAILSVTIHRREATMFGEWIGSDLPCNSYRHTYDRREIFAVNHQQFTKMVNFGDMTCRAATTHRATLTDDSVTKFWDACEIHVPLGKYRLKDFTAIMPRLQEPGHTA